MQLGRSVLGWVVKVKALKQDMRQHQKVCMVGNNFADKGAKWGLDKHPSSEPLREFIKSPAVPYKSIGKFMVTCTLKTFELRPTLPKIEKCIRVQETKSKGPGHTPFSTGQMAGFIAELVLGLAGELKGACSP